MNTPSFPKNLQILSGKTANLREIKEYGAILQKFIRETEANLKHEKNVRRYNDTVDYLEHIAKHYNHELHVFNREEQKRQIALLCKFMQQSTS